MSDRKGGRNFPKVDVIGKTSAINPKPIAKRHGQMVTKGKDLRAGKGK
ncbi:MAG: hypothetical protein LBK23_09570 [Oscillospiraceae bacterium]|nr:hypothetical protein [Oscillospiraceae bacterium]